MEIMPNHFTGWVIGFDRGFIKLHKRINGKVRSVYIGKALYASDAIQRIRDKIRGIDDDSKLLSIRFEFPADKKG